MLADGGDVTGFHRRPFLGFPSQVSKVGLMWGGELKPTDAEAAPLLRDLSERVLHLFALYNGIRLAAGAGSTLAHDLARRASAVMMASEVRTLDYWVGNPDLSCKRLLDSKCRHPDKT